jgi:cytoskeletal protein CcmA (bactofilin family)
MFDNKKSINYHLQFTNEIGAGSQVLGNLEGNGHFLVNGNFIGNLTEAESSKSTLVIDKNGVIKGDVHYTNLIVAGRIEGSITVDEKMEAYPSAVIQGDIRYKILDIHPEAKVDGLLSCAALDIVNTSEPGVVELKSNKKLA